MNELSVGAVDLVIRPIQGEEETKACARLMANSEPWVTLQRSYEESYKMLKDPSREVYVGRLGDETVGFLILVMKGAFVGYLQTVGLHREWRNRGIGSKLIEFAEERIFREAPNVFICVSSFNQEALRLYERLGYHIVGELKDYIINGHSEILLRKSIAPLNEFKNKR